MLDNSCLPIKQSQTYIILGSTGSEPYLSGLLKQGIRVICVNLEFSPELDDTQLLLERGDFNQMSLWDCLILKYPKQIDRIIFDSSTTKFINNRENVWNLELNGLTHFRHLLRRTGEIYFDSILSSNTCYSANFMTEILTQKQTIGSVRLLPLLTRDLIQTMANISHFPQGIDWNQAPGLDGYGLNDYVDKLTKIAKLYHWDICYLTNSEISYPLTPTTYSINNYLVCKISLDRDTECSNLQQIIVSDVAN